MKKIDKGKWAKELANKTPETHAEVMQKLGISPKEDKKWHKEHGGKPADFSKLAKKYWSKKVTLESNALDLERGVFVWDDPKRIAVSLANSAKTSTRRKGTPRQSAMSMLNFYING